MDRPDSLADKPRWIEEHQRAARERDRETMDWDEAQMGAMAGGPRAEVQRFGLAMEAKLIMHDRKGGWLGMSPEEHFAELLDEVTELREALVGMDPDDVLKEAADVANRVMMIADTFLARGSAP